VILALFGALWEPGCLVVLLAAPMMVKPMKAVRRGASGPALIEVLSSTGQLQLVVGALLTGGLVFI
jgi:1,4-dihydroxy-2-naphthoate octaprenyltransferase